MIKDMNCRDSILWRAIWFKIDSLLCSKQFTHKIKYFIYFDDLASCGYPSLSFSKVCKERWNIFLQTVQKNKKTSGLLKSMTVFQQDFFKNPCFQKWFKEKMNVWWTYQPLCEDVWHAPSVHLPVSTSELMVWRSVKNQHVFELSSGCNPLRLEGFEALGPHW